MKKYIILALTSLLALTSCESFLDRSPLSDLSPSSYFKDKAEMKNWNAGIYDAFQSALSKRQVLFGDVRSDNVTGTTYEDSKIYMNALMPNISDAVPSYIFNTVFPVNPSQTRTFVSPDVILVFRNIQLFLISWSRNMLHTLHNATQCVLICTFGAPELGGKCQLLQSHGMVP